MVLVAATISVIEAVEAILPAEVRMVSVIHGHPLWFWPVAIVTAAKSPDSTGYQRPGSRQDLGYRYSNLFLSCVFTF